MNVVRAEFLKLKRSLSWTVVVLLPVVMVVSGVVNTLVSGERLGDGWHTLWLRSVVFYGLFPLAIGIGLLASLVWRVEHRGGNWNALMSGPVSPARTVAAKATVTGTLAAAMQVVLVVCVIVTGKVVFALPGMLPQRYFLVSALIMLASVPVAVLQSGLSMLLRSFAAPIAIAFLGAGVSAVLLLAEVDAAGLTVPYALLARTTQLGTGTFADTGESMPGAVAPIVIAALALTALLTAATAAILDRRDTRT